MARVLIIYKSGAQIVVRCKEFTASRNALGELTEIQWNQAKPSPLFAGINDIAAIWQVKS